METSESHAVKRGCHIDYFPRNNSPPLGWCEPLAFCRLAWQEPQHRAWPNCALQTNRCCLVLRADEILHLPFILACLLNIYSSFKPQFDHLFPSPLTQREFYIKEVSFCIVYLTTHYAKVISFYSEFICCLITQGTVGGCLAMRFCFKWFPLLLLMFSQNVTLI